MDAAAFGFGFAAGLLLIPFAICEIIDRMGSDDDTDLEQAEYDGWITVHPDLKN